MKTNEPMNSAACQPALIDLESSPPSCPAELRTAKKADLHRHLLGSTTKATALLVSAKYGAKLPTHDMLELDDYLKITTPVTGLRELFRPWAHLSRLIVSPNALSRLAYEALKDAAADNVRYVELRTSWNMTGRESFDVKTFIAALDIAARTAEERLGVTGKFLLGITRHLMSKHTPQNRDRLLGELLEAAVPYKNTCIVGFDVSGVEEGNPLSTFRNFLRLAKEQGFSLSIHCGETMGPKTVWEAIEAGANRISHALAIVADNKLLDRVVQDQIPIEMCLTSNVMSSAISSLKTHPLRALLHAGAFLVLATDNPAMHNITLSSEYGLAMDQLGLKLDDVHRLIDNSFKARFWDGKIE